MPDPKDLRARLDAASLTISLERSGSGSSSYAILEITSIARAALDEVEALRKQVGICAHRFDSTVCVAPAGHDGPHTTSNATFIHGLVVGQGDLVKENAALRERVRVLEEALRPFASIGPYTSDWKDGHGLSVYIVGDPNESFDFTMGDVRRACRLLIGS